MAYNNDGSVFVTCGRDNVAEFYDAATNKLQYKLEDIFVWGLEDASFAPKGNDTMVFVSVNGRIKVYDTKPMAENQRPTWLKTIEPEKNGRDLNGISHSPTDGTFITVYSDRHARVFNASAANEFTQLTGDCDYCGCGCDEDGQKCGCTSGCFHTGHTDFVLGIAHCTGNGEHKGYWCTVSEDQTVRIFDEKNNFWCKVAIEVQVRSVSWADDRVFICTSNDLPLHMMLLM